MSDGTPGAKYKPGNGTEGMMFMAQFCDNCIGPEDGDCCTVLAQAFAFDVTDPDYPGEWIYDDQGYPVCTAFEEKPKERCQLTSELFPEGL